jgi:two-component system chemotaxis response regulator CheB
MSSQNGVVGRDIVVLGGSSGGIPAAMELLRRLPADLPAAIFLVIHTSRDSPGMLPEILARQTALAVRSPADGEPIRHRQVYVAPPDHHLLVKPGIVRVVHGPRENGFRPAVDPLFRTAAKAYGPRGVACVLSGALDDGTYGAMLVKKHGGLVLAQSIEEAIVPGMPLSVMRSVEVDHILPVAEMADRISALARQPLREEFTMPRPEDLEPDVSENPPDALRTDALTGPPSRFACPECGGSMWELTEGDVLRFRCHVGHGFSGESLAENQSDSLEAALWGALRALEEQAELRRRMAHGARLREQEHIAENYEQQARDTEARADLIRKTLLG